MSQDSAALSLLSLSIAASNAQPIPLNEQSSKHPGALSHHRRLSSTGRRRRLSDARDAASRPLSVGSPVAHAMPASAPAKTIPIAQPAAAAAGARKKRGEACSKHRWEHTPHWRTLSSLPHPGPGVLSKHAQVQLLEAAAILSHLSSDSETGTSLSEDRGMWSRWVGGGALEGEDDVLGSVPASVSSAYGYPSSVGGGGYSGGGGSEYGSAGWREMCQCTIAYTSDPPRPVPRRRGYAARSLPAPIGIPADSPRRPHELTVRPALSPRRFEGRVGSSRRECPAFAQGSAWRSASPVVSPYARAPHVGSAPHTAHTRVGIKSTNIYTPQSQ
ncbi:hypothetical protein B0H14DRAFT_3462767 [Mycena olivaceomarginata]|nr:hypothetical protein B0H14DRAFT_3462767 [Mycena olivaceomarginata]